MIFERHSLKELLLAGCLAAAAFFAASCQKDVFVFQKARPYGETTYTVTFEPATKSTLDAEYFPEWEVGEEVSVYDPIAKAPVTFTVTEVNGSSATISGNISKGDFAFSAVYPASAVDAWVDDSTCLWTVPQEQTIPSGRNIAPDALVSTAFNQSGEIVFRNQTALLDFTVDEPDMAAVKFNIGDQEYTVSPKTGTLAKGSKYHLAVYPGEYSDGITTTATTVWDISYGKHSANTLDAARNTYVNLGSLTAKSEKRYGYQITSEGTYSGLTSLLEASGYMDDLSSFVKGLIEVVLFPLVPKKDYDMHIYRYTYTSEGPDKKPVKQSSLIYVFEDAVSGKSSVDGITLVNHETFTADSECPTRQCALLGAFAWKGHAAICPDYLGFGASVQYPQAYLIADIAARNNLDAYFAGLQILKDKGIKVNSKRYTLGYSQGGFNAVDNLRYTVLHPELSVKFDKVFAGDGPYDVPASLTDYLSGNYDDCNAYIALSVLSMVDYGQTGLKYSDILKGPILTYYNDWYISKTRSASYINARMGDDVTDFIREDIIDGSSPHFAKIMEEAERNSLCQGGWKPESGTNLYVCHSSKDDMVPYSNFEALKSYLSGASGC
ncbi:MAG: hypothetical protein MJY53_06125, partial [Bacteroidales bacterium]|nr:hypothetical protein [Bacteroidales bacterium]